MTENKRYISRDYPDGIIDTKNNKEYNVSSYYEDIDKIIDLLNEQEETIQNQKMEINLLLEEMKEIRDKLTIYLEIKGDVDDRKTI